MPYILQWRLYEGFYGSELSVQDKLIDSLRKRIRQRTISYQQTKSPKQKTNKQQNITFLAQSNFSAKNHLKLGRKK